MLVLDSHRGTRLKVCSDGGVHERVAGPWRPMPSRALGDNIEVFFSVQRLHEPEG